MRLDFESNTASLPFTENGLSDDSAVNSQTKELLREGVKAAQAGNRATARTLLVRVTEIEPRNENAWLWLASISEYPEELVVFLNNVLEINPHNERALEWMAATKSLLAKTFVQRGIDASKENRLDFSKQCFEQALTQDENNEMAWLWLASIVDSEEEKRAHLGKLLSINPANESAQNALHSLDMQAAQKLLQTANQYAAAGDRQNAADALAEVLETAPGLADAWLLKAHLTDSFDEKIKCFRRVLEINPEHQAAGTALASLQTLMEFTAPQMSFENTSPAPQIESETPVEQIPEITEEEEKEEEASFAEENLHAEDSTVEMSAEPEQLTDEMPAAQENQVSAEDMAAATAQTEEFSYTEEYFYHEHQEAAAEESPAAEVNFAAETEWMPNEAVFQTEPANESGADYQPEFQTAGTFEGRSEISAGETAPEDDETEFSVMSAEEFTAGQESEDEDNSAAEQPYTSFESENNEAVNLNNYAAGFDEVEEAAGQSTTDPYRTETDFNPDENYRAENVEENQNQPDKEAEYFAYSEPAKEAEYFTYPKPAADFAPAEPISDEPVSEVPQEAFFEPPVNETKPAAETMECPFCSSPNEAQAFACRDCRATLSLSDLEMLLGNEQVDKVRLQQIVSRMEMDKNMRGFNAAELTNLGIGHINLKNLRQGFAYLQESAQMNPNNVMLASQVNALAIRLAEIEQKEEDNDSKPKGKTILVIDDSATVRKLISGKLEKSGHEVVCAVDGMDALAKLNEVVPDLILLDITMPRMDGYQVCKLIRNNPLTKNIPVVMISGKDGFFDKVRGRMAGTTGYITKPFGPETLMKALEMYISDNNEAEAI